MKLQTSILSRSELNVFEWDTFVQTSPQGNIFGQVNYLDSVHQNWRALIIDQKGKWVGIMPLPLVKRGPFRACMQPIFAQQLGLMFADQHDKSVYRAFSSKRKIVQAAIAALEDFHLVSVYFSEKFDYPLPFHEKAYQLETRFTYQINLNGTEASLHQQLAPPLDRQIKKAERAGIDILVEKDEDVLFYLIDEQLKHGKDLFHGKPQYKKNLTRLINNLEKKGQLQIYVAKDLKGTPLAAGCFAFFRQKCHYLQGVYHPGARNSGAMSALMWHAICNAKAMGNEVFDFCGSMKPEIEAFFRKFGAKPVPYLHINRNSLPIIARWIQELRS